MTSSWRGGGCLWFISTEDVHKFLLDVVRVRIRGFCTQIPVGCFSGENMRATCACVMIPLAALMLIQLILILWYCRWSSVNVHALCIWTAPVGM